MPHPTTLATVSALAAALVLATTTAAPAMAQTAETLASLAWLEGCWVGRAGDRVIEEHWLPLRAGTLVAASRTSRGERTTGVELAVIRLRGDTPVYEARPVGQAPAVFTLEARSDSSVTFADPAHDFPQRIRYARVGADSLHARIEGTDRDGRTQGLDFRYRREPCTGTTP